jgi:UDP-N-acetylglucosamine--N-acetylmuramyl-(pentapeptide) pyrophosphoryl-undecaprenol N-acetylglucosamine transferase
MKTILIFGGSSGAKRLNEVIIQLWKRSPAWLEHFQVLHITGEKNLAAVQKSYAGLSVKAQVIPFCHDMPAAYAASDVIVSRSGASTIAELSIVGKPAVLIPYPYASEDHQAHNAQVLVHMGQATMIREVALTADRLDEAIQQILFSSLQIFR